MLKTPLKIIALALTLCASTACFAATSIESTPACAMKNLDVACENGDKIKLDVVRSDDNRGDIFLNINTNEDIGHFLTVSIDNSKPEVLRVENVTASSKGAFIPRSMIMKLRSATSLSFKISMKKRNPISGSLGESHFEWLKRFGKTCG